MEAYIVGGIIKEFRLRFNISQEELCDGLCAVSTLSRIESGKQITGRKLIEALFSRMGLRPHTSAIPMSKIDLKRENIEYRKPKEILKDLKKLNALYDKTFEELLK